MIERHIKVATHGRYLVKSPAGHRPAPVLVGFHGYAENAAVQLERLQAIPGSERWLLVSIQALHRFYQPRTNDVVASWMTRQDRELAIADNLAYVRAVLEAVAAEYQALPTVVYAGFSQGVAMAFRAAARATEGPSVVIAAGGDVPPELDPVVLQRISAALICRGSFDALYPAEAFAADIERLQHSGVRVQGLGFDGGHEWSRPVADRAALFIADWGP